MLIGRIIQSDLGDYPLTRAVSIGTPEGGDEVDSSVLNFTYIGPGVGDVPLHYERNHGTSFEKGVPLSCNLWT